MIFTLDSPSFGIEVLLMSINAMVQFFFLNAGGRALGYQWLCVGHLRFIARLL